MSADFPPGQPTFLTQSLETPVPRETVFEEWIGLVDLPIRATNCLRNAKCETLGDVLDRFGPGLLDLYNFGRVSYWQVARALEASGHVLSLDPKVAPESDAERARREDVAVRAVPMAARRKAIFRAAADGSRTYAEIGQQFGISGERARGDYHQERRRLAEEWNRSHPVALLIDMPLILRRDMGRALLRALTGQGATTERDARAGLACGRVALSRWLLARLDGYVLARPSRKPPKPTSRVLWAPHVRTPLRFGVISEDQATHFGCLMPDPSGAGYHADERLRERLEEHGVTDHAWPTLAEAKSAVVAALERRRPPAPAVPAPQ